MLKTRAAVLLFTAAFILATGCGTAGAGEGYKDWRDVEFSEETVEREAAEREISEDTQSDEEERSEAIAEYERRFAATVAEEKELLSQLAYMRETAALPELPEKLRGEYAVLVSETEEDLAVLRAEEERLKGEIERLTVLSAPPEELEFETYDTRESDAEIN